LSSFITIAFYPFPNAYFSSAFVSFVSSLSGRLSDKGVQSIRLASGPSLRGALSSGNSSISLLDGQSYFLVRFSSWHAAVTFFKQASRRSFQITDFLEDAQKKQQYQILDEIFSEPIFCAVSNTLLDIGFLRQYYFYPLCNPVREEISLSLPRSIRAAFFLFPYKIPKLLNRLFMFHYYLSALFQTVLRFWLDSGLSKDKVKTKICLP
jgi:hypothetical protein